MTEMQAFEAFGRLAKEGRAMNDIAAYFGVTELKVKRILALADLIPEIRKLYSEDDIDVATIRALTMASADQQLEWLRLYQSEDEHAPFGRRLKDWLSGGAAISTDKALFDLSDYPGRVLEDLFGENGQFEDADLFWEHQSAAIAARVEAYRSRGWKDVIVMERGSHFHQWDYVKRPKKSGGKVFISIRQNGEVAFHEGFVTSAEHRRAEAAATKGAGQKPAPVRSEMSGPLAQYVLLHRHGTARAGLLNAPEIALRFAVAHMMTGSALWDVRPHTPRTLKEATAESVMTAPAAIAMSDEEMEIEKLFKAKGVAFDLRRNGDDYRLAEVFLALQKMSDEDVLRVLAFVMAETLEAGGAAVETALHATASDPGASWIPDEAFFDLLRDKRAINAMVAEIAGPRAAKAALTETARTQKAIIRDCLTGNGREATPDWRPRWMTLPPAKYVSDAPSPPSDQWSRVSALFEAKETETDDKMETEQPAPAD